MNKNISFIIVAVLIIVAVFISVRDKKSNNDSYSQNQLNNQAEVENITNTNLSEEGNTTKEMSNATLHTNKGEITIEFFGEEAPNTVLNFTKLAGEGFYDGVKFHRVIKGFMIQAGDPLSKDDSKMATWGTGGPGYKFADEIDPKSALYTETGYKKGIVAMANSGPNTNGSQFFIMTENYPLPPLYTIFGKVLSGQDVVDSIANVKTGYNDRPVDAVIINSITLK